MFDIFVYFFTLKVIVLIPHDRNCSCWYILTGSSPSLHFNSSYYFLNLTITLLSLTILIILSPTIWTDFIIILVTKYLRFSSLAVYFLILIKPTLFPSLHDPVCLSLHCNNSSFRFYHLQSGLLLRRHWKEVWRRSEIEEAIVTWRIRIDV